MKKQLLLAAFAVAALTAGAQVTYVRNDLPSYFQVIPGEFIQNGQPEIVLTYGHDEVDSTGWDYISYLDSVVLYNSNLQNIGRLNSDYGTYSYFYVADWLEDTVAMEKPLYPVAINYQDIDAHGAFVDIESEFMFSQTLFNNDAEYEYLLPVIPSGQTCYEESVHVTAFNIMSGSEVVGTIQPPAGSNFAGTYVIMYKLGNQLYLLFEIRDENSEYEYSIAWYRINRQTSTVTLVEEMPVSVHPTLVRRGGDVTVELGEGASAHEISVVNGLGQTVKRIPVAEGQREVHINTGDLGSGVNFIGSKRGTTKIVVK